jgi:hypothetical protein
MAWQDELVTVLRFLINDLAAIPQYDDDRLEQGLVIAARLVLTEAGFTPVYTADVVNVDIKPDPTDDAGGSRNDAFTNLVATKAACIIDRGAASAAAGQAILVQDGTSRVDLRKAFDARLALLKMGHCAAYDTMLEEYLTGQGGVHTLGAAIMGPIRIWANYGGGRPFVTGQDPRWVR